MLATLATQRTDSLQAAGESHAVALNSGYHLAYLVGAALVGAALVLALTVLESKPAGAPKPARGRGGAGLLRGGLAGPEAALPAGLLFADLDPVDPSRGRPAAADLEQRLDRIGRSLEHGLDGSRRLG